MPLPSTDIVWPPSVWEPALFKIQEHAAWFSGDVDLLAEVYNNKSNTGFARGTWWQFWTPQRDMSRWERSKKVHLPLAGDLASMSASLLFAEPPTVTVPSTEGRTDTQAHDRLQEILEAIDFNSKLLEAGEIASALGGVYLRVVWDKEINPDYPFVDIVQPDFAIPEFRWGKLVAVTFWRHLASGSDSKVYRHLERYEPGAVLHGLYEGSSTKLGRSVNLESHVDTQGLSEVVPVSDQRLLAAYVPNMLPNRMWRAGPLHVLGQSDYSGSEGLLDSLDEVWTSWIRDIRLARARLVVPEEYLEKRDNNLMFDVDQEVFTPLDIESRDASIQSFQFAIRSQEHSDTALDLIERIITHAGYSPQSFGLQIAGRAESGTALRIRERKTLITQQKKRSYFEGALPQVLENLLAMYRDHFKTVKVERPNVELADSIIPDMSETAAVVDMLNRAMAISIEQKVRMIHQAWADEDIELEIQRIKAEQGMFVENPEDRV